MGLIVTIAPVKPVVLCALKCTIGSTYRRQSEPDKLYIAVRGNDATGGLTNEPLLVSLDHGNRVTTNLGVPDFIEVVIKAQVTDKVVL